MTSPNNGTRAPQHFGNRFHLLALAFQRVSQLHAGARPRVPAGHHKPTRLALLEVLADTISWSLAAEEPAQPPPTLSAAAHGAEA